MTTDDQYRMMHVSGGRTTGKTEWLLTWFAEQPHNRVIVARDKAARRMIVDRLALMQIPGWSRERIEQAVFDPESIQKGNQFWRRLPPRAEVGVDDVYLVLRDLLGGRRPTVTTSTEPLDVTHLRVAEWTSP